MKNLKNLGKNLNKNEQKLVNGGERPLSNSGCSIYYGCVDPFGCGSEGSRCELESEGPVILGTIANGLCCP